MRKSRFILVATLAVLGAVFAFARLAVGPATGTVVYLQNQATGQFVAASATVDEIGAAFEIKNEGDEADGFHSDSHVFSDPGHTYSYLRFQYAPATNSFLKVGNSSVEAGTGYHKWAVEQREKGWVIRSIYVSSQVAYSEQGKYLIAQDGKLVLTTEESDAIYWNFLGEEEYNAIIEEILAKREAELKAKVDAVMKNATVGTDVTELIENPQFATSTAGWTVNKGKIELKGSADNYVITAYNYTFDVSQTLKYLKQGTYKLQVQAFSRPTSNQGTIDLVAAGSELENYCYIYANDVEVPVCNISDEYLEEAGAGSWSSHEFEGKTIYLPNNGGGFSDAFTRGMYENELEVEVGEDGVLTLGIKNTKAPTGQGDAYCGYDNFRLTLVRDTQAELKALNKEVKNLLSQPMNSDAKAALQQALAANNASTYTGKYADAIDALKQAADEVAASIVAYEGIQACYESNRQFIPEQNLEAFDAACADILKGLEEGTITGNGIPEMKEIVLATTLYKTVAEPEELAVVEVSTQCEFTEEYQPGAAHGITIDWDGIAETLDVEKDGLKIYAVLSDGTLDENYTLGSTDGWRNADGDWAAWGSGDERFFVQFRDNSNPLALTGVGGRYLTEPTTFTAKFKIVNADDVEGDWVTLNISLNVVAPPPAVTLDELNSTIDVAQDLNEPIGVGYAGDSFDVDVASILAQLGAESLSDVKIYAVQSDGTLDKNYGLGTTDGWRNADGDWASWGDATSQFYVKADFSRESGQLYEVGGHPTHNGAHLTEPVTYVAKYAFVNSANDAVILSVNFVVDYKDAELAEGKYYLYNNKAGLYWGAGNSWGTQASLVEHPEYVTLIPNEDGTYNLESQVSNGGTNYYFGGDYMDGSPVALTIKVKSEGQYIIKNGTTVYGYDGTSTVLGKGVEGDAAVWTIYSEADMLTALAAATVDAPQDATFLILDPNFGRNNRNASAWTFEASNKTISGGNNTNNNAESYHAVFTLSQTLNDVPNGVYTLTAQAFYRQDGSDNDNLPYFFLNDGTVTFPVKTGSENSMSDASGSFTNGLYTVEPIIVKVEDGTITLGAKLEGNTTLWCIWDNFVLTYYGADATIDQVAAQANVEIYKDALAAAEAVDQTADMPAASLEALQTALTDYSNLLEGEYTAELLAEATEALKAATQAANAGIQNAAAIAAMRALVDNTNVYTPEALATFTAYFDKYEAGELTEVVVNPDNVQGWHAANIYDDLLLSAWTIGGNQCADFNTALYINTWSVEADNKENGSGMHVPFFEYWTGDANSLGANPLVATLNNLSAGTYEVEALVRVRIKNDGGDEAYGISFSVNDGEAVDVAAGETCDDGAQFRYGTYTAVGEVGADGVLTIKFDVAEDNNISWLSYKNVYYTKVGGDDTNPDAPESEVPYGWKTLIANGNFAESDASNFYVKNLAGNPEVAEVISGIGVDGSHGVEVVAAANPAEDWDSQFFIKANESLPAGKMIHVEFDYRADVPAQGDTQWHSGNPGDFKHYAAIGSPNFTTEWQHYSFEGAIPSQADGSNIIAFNLSKLKDSDNKYYFDNIVFWVEDPQPEEIDNFDKLQIAKTINQNVLLSVGDTYVGAVATVDVAEILSTLGVESLEGVAIYAVQSDGTLDPDLGSKANNWGGGDHDGWRDVNGDWALWGDATSQFYVKADFSLESEQLWSIGGHPDHSGAHLTEAVTYTAKYAFVVGDNSIDNTTVVLNVNVVFASDDADAPEPEVAEGWKSVITNGNFAGEDVVNYFWASTTAEGLQTATIENGIGVDGGHGIKVSTPASHSNGYETQFFIKSNEPIAGGTQIRIEFDCRAATAASPNTQGHAQPQQYLAWSPFGNVNFTTEWTHYSWTGTAPNPGNDGPFQTFVIDLGNSDNNTFYFDNIVFWVEDAEAGVKDATAINGIAGEQNVEGIFNAQGQKLDQLQKGLNIVNGKKVYVK